MRKRDTYASHNMEDAWTSYANAYSRLSSQVSVRSGGISGGLFISKRDETNATIKSLLANVRHWKTWNAKYDLHTQVVESLSNDCSAVHHGFRVAMLA